MRQRFTRRNVLLLALAAAPFLASCTISGSVQQQRLQEEANATATPTPGTPTVAPTTSAAAGTPRPSTATALPSPQPTFTPGGHAEVRLGAAGTPAELDAYRSMAAAYGKATPSTTITVEEVSGGAALQQALAAGTAPDVVTVPWDALAGLANTGALDDLTSVLGANKLDTTGLFTLPKDFGTVGGKTLALPLSFDPRVLYVNLDRFAAAGLQTPTVTFDWQHFQDAATRLSAGDVTGFATGTTAFDWFPWVWAAGGAVFDDELSPSTCTLSDPAATSGLQQFADLWLKHEGAAAPSSTSPIEAFVSGKAGMVVGSRADVATIKKAAVKWQVTYLPQGPGGHATTYVTTLGAVSRASRQPYAAGQFLGFLATDQQSQTLLARTGVVVPALQAAAVSPDFKTTGVDVDDSVFTQTLLFAYQPPRTPVWSNVQAAWTPDLEQVWAGKQSAQDAAKAAVPKVNDVLKTVAATPTAQPFAIQPLPTPTPSPQPTPAAAPPASSVLPSPTK